MATDMTHKNQLDDLARWSRRVCVIIDGLIPEATQTLDAAGWRADDTSKLKAELLLLVRRIDDANNKVGVPISSYRRASLGGRWYPPR